MSVSKVASSFVPPAFSKAIPAMALVAGVCIGMTVGIIGEIKKINDANTGNPDIKKGITQRVTIVFFTWCATPVLALAGLASRHPGFGMLAAASSAVSLAVMVSIKGEVQKNPAAFQGDTQTKLARAVEYVFAIAIPSIATLACTLVIDTLEHWSRRN